MTGTSRNTLKQRFRHLLEKGHLIMHGRGRGLVCIDESGLASEPGWMWLAILKLEPHRLPCQEVPQIP
jgi:hypothetical protein